MQLLSNPMLDIPGAHTFAVHNNSFPSGGGLSLSIKSKAHCLCAKKKKKAQCIMETKQIVVQCKYAVNADSTKMSKSTLRLLEFSLHLKQSTHKHMSLMY